MITNKNYSSLAETYDHLMRRINYKEWAFYLYKITKPYINKQAAVLELASGNCKLACNLIKYYPDITASDLSIEMLKHSPACKITKVCCNMASLPFKTKFDLIYSAFDSVNYLLTKESLLKFLKECENLLADDGILTFDVSLENNSLKHIKVKERIRKYKEIKYIQVNDYNRKSGIHTNAFTFFFPGDKEIKEVHRQKIYPFDFYFKIIEKTNLYISECYKAFSLKAGTAESDRVQFILKKKNNAHI